MTRLFRGFVSNSLTLTMVSGTDATAFPTEAKAEWRSGETGRLRITLDEPGSGVVDSINVPIVLDRQTGIVQELVAWIQANGTGGASGLTTEEHDSLVITQAAVTAGFGLDPLTLVGDLVQAIAGSNPLAYGSLSSPADCVSGDGEMPDPEPLLPKWGLYWLATVIPEGLGHVHGQSEEYPARLVQWRTVHEVGGVEMVTEINDAVTHGELWRFRFQRPRRVEYSVLPGVTICAQWWQFP